jgi:hypothetical protein
VVVEPTSAKDRSSARRARLVGLAFRFSTVPVQLYVTISNASKTKIVVVVVVIDTLVPIQK